jgi:GTP-binding protein
MFIGPGEKIYAGMLFGEHNKGQDVNANPLKTKQLTNVRASGSDDAIVLTPPVRFTLERAISYIGDDELVEVTPQSIRLRKRYLDPHERKRHARQMAETA